MRSEVVVCTRNRAGDIIRLLETLQTQTVKPRLIVVDSSDDTSTEEAVRSFREIGCWPDVFYVRCEPGLTRQRVFGVACLSSDCEIVHFLDDDVILEPGYFAAVESCFDSDPAIVGVGGAISNAIRPRSPHPLNRLFLLDSNRQGVVLRSGVNVRCFEFAERLEVEWLSGCSMSYRRCVFDVRAFDTGLTGYSLGEDVDFSYGVRPLGKLVVCPDARLAHLERGASAADRRASSHDEVIRRYRFVRKYRGQGVSVPAFWWSVFGDILLTAGKAIVLEERALQRQKLRGLLHGVHVVLSCGAIRL